MKTFPLFYNSEIFLPILKIYLSLAFLNLQWPPPVFGDGGSDAMNPDPFKRFEYTFSFKGPYLAQPDGSIPFWERRGHALPHDSNIRITPSLRNQRGGVWTKNRTTFDEWEVELMFRISGRGKTGGEGLAFWYVEEKPEDGVAGELFGGFNGPWKGLGLFWDTYDNDGNYNNPSLVAIDNDGSKVYDPETDGQPLQCAYHKKDYRNQLFYSRARIIYRNNTLSVLMTNGRTKETSDRDFEPFFLHVRVNLPKFGYFGVSAATGSNFVDDHDISKFLTFSLHNRTNPTAPGQGQGQPEQVLDTEEEAEKYKKEFQKWQENLEKQRAVYKTEHPAEEKKAHHDEHDPEDDYADDDEYLKELRGIFEQQHLSRGDIHHVETLLDKVFGSQDVLTSALVRYQQSIPPGQGSAPIAGAIPVGLQRFEVENLLAANRELLSITAEIKTVAGKLEQQIGIAEGKNKPRAEFPGIPLSEKAEIEEATREIHQLESGMRLIVTKLSEDGGFAGHGSCSWGCISTKSFVFLNVLSTLALLGYMIYRDNNSREGPLRELHLGNKPRFY